MILQTWTANVVAPFVYRLLAQDSSDILSSAYLFAIFGVSMGCFQPDPLLWNDEPYSYPKGISLLEDCSQIS